MITDMTRSLEIVETLRSIYSMTMFGHRKCFGRFWTYTGVPGGYRNPPGSILGLMGASGRRGGAARAAARPLPL